jgi:hypothetical protein
MKESAIKVSAFRCLNQTTTSVHSITSTSPYTPIDITTNADLDFIFVDDVSPKSSSQSFTEDSVVSAADEDTTDNPTSLTLLDVDQEYLRTAITESEINKSVDASISIDTNFSFDLDIKSSSPFDSTINLATPNTIQDVENSKTNVGSTMETIYEFTENISYNQTSSTYWNTDEPFIDENRTMEDDSPADAYAFATSTEETLIVASANKNIRKAEPTFQTTTYSYSSTYLKLPISSSVDILETTTSVENLIGDLLENSLGYNTKFASQSSEQTSITRQFETKTTLEDMEIEIDRTTPLEFSVIFISQASNADGKNKNAT